LGTNKCRIALFSQKYPELGTKFYNRGVSGDRVIDLQARWQKDCLDLQPTWVSIYIGINDTWRRYDSDDPTSVVDFKARYHDLLMQTKQKLNAKLILVLAAGLKRVTSLRYIKTIYFSQDGMKILFNGSEGKASALKVKYLDPIIYFCTA
jgi:lysophospholipase L1-like esterase